MEGCGRKQDKGSGYSTGKEVRAEVRRDKSGNIKKSETAERRSVYNG